jgi:hypothetical protein
VGAFEYGAAAVSEPGGCLSAPRACAVGYFRWSAGKASAYPGVADGNAAQQDPGTVDHVRQERNEGGIDLFELFLQRGDRALLSGDQCSANAHRSNAAYHELTGEVGLGSRLSCTSTAVQEFASSSSTSSSRRSALPT